MFLIRHNTMVYKQRTGAHYQERPGSNNGCRGVFFYFNRSIGMILTNLQSDRHLNMKNGSAYLVDRWRML